MSAIAVADAVSVDGLIEQLGSRDFKSREAAARALSSRGEEALPAMRKALNHPDPEVRKRLEQLVADAERAALLAPKRITMKFTGPLKEALAELSNLSGYRMDLQAGGGQGQTVDIDVKDVTFWEAFDNLANQAGLVLQQHHDMQGGLIVYAQNMVTPFVDYRGPFRVWATGFHYNKSLVFGSLPRGQAATSQRSEQMSFMFSLVSEPKLPLLGLGQARLTAAIDDLNNSLVPPAVRNGVYETYHSGYYGYRNLVLQSQVALLGPSTSAHSIKLIKGAVPVTLLAEQRPDVVVEPILNIKEKKIEGKDVVLDITEAKEGPGGMYQITMSAKRKGSESANDYTWINSLHQRIELLDEKGQPFQSRGFNWGNSTPTTVKGTFMFGVNGNAQLGKPRKLIYYTWVTMQHQVEFEFKDLPLP